MAVTNGRYHWKPKLFLLNHVPLFSMFSFTYIHILNVMIMPVPHALHLVILWVQHMDPSAGNPSKLPMDRAMLYASALLWFHFNYGYFVRWLGGEDTNRHRDWDDIFNTLTEARQ
jgi:hypothetical protein